MPRHPLSLYEQREGDLALQHLVDFMHVSVAGEQEERPAASLFDYLGRLSRHLSAEGGVRGRGEARWDVCDGLAFKCERGAKQQFPALVRCSKRISQKTE